MLQERMFELAVFFNCYLSDTVDEMTGFTDEQFDEAWSEVQSVLEPDTEAAIQIMSAELDKSGSLVDLFIEWSADKGYDQ